MKNTKRWVPTKYVFKNGRLIASRNRHEVSTGSRLVADIAASYYQTYIPKYAKGKLIDLGCGKAPLYGLYKTHVTDVTCVDWANSQHANSHLDFECDLNSTLPFNDNQFDSLILSDVLEHIAEPERLWREMARILNKNGIAFVNTPFFYRLHETPHDFYRYTEFALRRFCRLH